MGMVSHRGVHGDAPTERSRCGEIVSAWGEPERPSAGGPGKVKVGRFRLAGLVHTDLVELRELAVVARHHSIVLDDAGLIGHDRNVGPSPLALQAYVHRLAGAQVASPPERRADQQRTIMTGIGDRDGVMPAGFAATT